MVVTLVKYFHFKRGFLDKKKKKNDHSANDVQPKQSLPVFCEITEKIYDLRRGQTLATFQRNILQHFWAQHVAYVWLPCCDMLRAFGQSIHDMLRAFGQSIQHMPEDHATMLQDVALKRCETVWPGLYTLLAPQVAQLFLFSVFT